MSGQTRFPTALVILVALFLAGCGGAKAPGTPGGAVGQSAPAQLTKITLVQAHSDITLGEEIPMYAVPKALGFFKEEGIEVNLQGSSGGSAAIQLLISGSAQFATGAAEVIMQTRDKGGKVKAVYDIKRRSGWAIALLPDSPVKTLADLKGRTIGVQSLASGGIPIIRQSLAEVGLKEGDYTLLAVGTGAQAAAALTSKKVDSLGLWEAVYATIENQGVKMRYLDLPILDKVAGLSMATTDDYIKEHSKVVIGLGRAIAKGFEFTQANPVAAVKVFYQVFPDKRPPGISEDQAIKGGANILAAWMANATKGHGPSTPWLYNSPEQWAFSQEQILASGTLKTKRAPNEYITNEFMKEINNFDAVKIQELARNYK